MTRDSNLSMQRRVEALESRLAATQRALDSQAQRARMWAWPRDTWLGRTTSSSYSNYPTEGDTFQVKLLSSHFTAAEGTRGVTENERGTVVTARTWPAKYLGYDTEVVVKRMRGIGPSGAGEWWIETAGGYDRCVMVGGGGTGYRYDGTQTESGDDIPYRIPGNPYNGIWCFPRMVGRVGNGAGVVFSVNNAPAVFTDWAIRMHSPCHYRITVHTTWELPPLDKSKAEGYLRAPGHDHAFTDRLAGGVSVPNQTDTSVGSGQIQQHLRKVQDYPVSIATEVWNGEFLRQEVGRSSLENWYFPEYPTPYPKYACHSGVMHYTNEFHQPGDPLEGLGFQVYRLPDSNVGSANVWDVRVTIEQSSDPF
jgi:hypothetical protein